MLWNADVLIGTQLGSCTLERALGVGGMGAVYLARQVRPHRPVAVKILRPQLTTDPRDLAKFLARFRQEADATAALDHANIVPIYEFGEQSDIAYLVMPYLANGSLAGLLARRGPLTAERVLAYLTQAAAALDYAHGHGIIHRDVKPSNLLLHPDGRLLLADFGIARLLDGTEPTLQAGAGQAGGEMRDDGTLTQVGKVLGTPHYMAPEQIRGEPSSAATDVYALGAVAYTMLSGRSPFGDGATGEILRRQLAEEPLPLRTLRPDVPQQVEEAVRWALGQRPEDRPASAGAFARALSQAYRGQESGSSYALAAGAGDGYVLPMSLHARVEGSAQHDAGMGESVVAYDAPTLYDAARAGIARVAVPAWPTAVDEAGPRSWLRAAGRPRFTVAVVLAAAVLLLVVGLFSGFALSQHSSPGGPTLGIGPRPTATITPKPSPTAMPSPTPVINWLSVMPANVSLGCTPRTKIARVVLHNYGAGDTWWSASYNWLGGISVSPLFGPIPGGNSVTITITNTTPGYAPGQRGTIQFKPNDTDAGDPASLSYTTQSCSR
jgi:hypothetical protein